MLVLPAIDLLEGACVRLRQGDYDRATEFSREPVAVARRFVAEGARALHVVDLEGARTGRPVHRDEVAAVCTATDVPVQVGGGVRSREDAETWMGAGARRVILGTAAVGRPELLARLLASAGSDRVVAAVDVRDGRVVVRGWTEDSGLEKAEALERLAAAGVSRVLYTNVRRDGTLTRPDVDGARDVIEAGFRTLVAGGVSRVSHVEALREAGAEGCVLGSALYRGALELEEALAAAGPQEVG